MKVLFIIPGSEEGNSMIFARRQIASLQLQGVVSSTFYLQSRTNPWIMIREFYRFRKVQREFMPNLVHCHYGTATALFAAVSHRKPLVITYHGSDLNFVRTENFFTEIFGKLFSQLAALRGSALICVSEKLKKKLWWEQGKTVVIPMGVDEKIFRPLDGLKARQELGIAPEEKIILFNYNRNPLKRLDLAETALHSVKQHFPTARLWVLSGDTTPDKMPALLNASDCLLLCSDTEGSPTIVKEAMACNLPVVSTDVGDVRQHIEKTFPHSITEQSAKSLAAGIADVFHQNKRSNGREILISLGLTERLLSGKVFTLYHSILKRQ